MAAACGLPAWAHLDAALGAAPAGAGTARARALPRHGLGLGRGRGRGPGAARPRPRARAQRGTSAASALAARGQVGARLSATHGQARGPGGAAGWPGRGLGPGAARGPGGAAQPGRRVQPLAGAASLPRRTALDGRSQRFAAQRLGGHASAGVEFRAMVGLEAPTRRHSIPHVFGMSVLRSVRTLIFRMAARYLVRCALCICLYMYQRIPRVSIENDFLPSYP